MYRSIDTTPISESEEFRHMYIGGRPPQRLGPSPPHRLKEGDDHDPVKLKTFIDQWQKDNAGGRFRKKTVEWGMWRELVVLSAFSFHIHPNSSNSYSKFPLDENQQQFANRFQVADALSFTMVVIQPKGLLRFDLNPGSAQIIRADLQGVYVISKALGTLRVSKSNRYCQ